MRQKRPKRNLGSSPEDFQQYLERDIDYWRDFGRRSALAMQLIGVQVVPVQVEHIVTNALAAMTAQTSGKLSEDRADAFAEGIRTELLKSEKGERDEG